MSSFKEKLKFFDSNKEKKILKEPQVKNKNDEINKEEFEKILNENKFLKEEIKKKDLEISLLKKELEQLKNGNQKNKLNEMKIIYKIKEDKKSDIKEIKFFGDKFVENNKLNAKIIINDKEVELCEYINIKDIILNEKIYF